MYVLKTKTLLVYFSFGLVDGYYVRGLWLAGQVIICSF